DAAVSAGKDMELHTIVHCGWSAEVRLKRSISIGGSSTAQQPGIPGHDRTPAIGSNHNLCVKFPGSGDDAPLRREFVSGFALENTDATRPRVIQQTAVKHAAANG